MKRHWVSGIILLMSLSLAGIILVQVLWIRNAVEVKEAQFRRSANEALTEIAEGLQMNETIEFITDRVVKDAGEKDVEIEGFTFVDKDFSDSLIKNFMAISSSDDSSFNYSYSTSGLDSVFMQPNPGMTGHSYKVIQRKVDSMENDIKKPKSMMFFEDRDKKTSIVIRKNEGIEYKVRKLDDALEKLTMDYVFRELPLHERFGKEMIEQTIGRVMQDKDLPSEYNYMLRVREGKDSLFVASEGFAMQDTLEAYRTGLFPVHLFSSDGALYIDFPGKESHIFGSVSFLLGGSVLFTLIILLTFIITIKTILRQKKISEIKSDFINNMTHEFKTPIATISLAADSIGNPRVLGDKKNILYYTGIIKEENKRMDSQVEHILRMSLLDRNAFELNPETADVHELIEKTLEHMQLQINKYKGRVITDLNAGKHLARVDRIHFVNVLYNLIDNALKYASPEPEIHIRTYLAGKQLHIAVRDNGPGLSRENRKKIFDKFFRVHTGNIHNVKGFGLGLAYVKAVIGKLAGEVEVKSEAGQGSIFIIKLPSIS